MYYIKGVNGQIELRKNRVIISRKGFLGYSSQGLAGAKEIPIKNITAVQFKEPGGMTNGFLQFSILGGVEAKGGLQGAATDENTVLFSASQVDNFRNVKAYVDSIIDEEPLEFESLNLPKVAEAQAPATARQPGATQGKSVGIAYLLWLIAGMLGAHRFYVGKTNSAVVILILTMMSIVIGVATGGIGFIITAAVSIWVLIDAFLIPGLVRTANSGAGE